MVPLRQTARLVGARIGGKAKGTVITLSFAGSSLTYELGHHSYRLNGRRQNITAASEMRKGHLFVPIRLFTDLTSGRVRAEIL